MIERCKAERAGVVAGRMLGAIIKGAFYISLTAAALKYLSA